MYKNAVKFRQNFKERNGVDLGKIFKKIKSKPKKSKKNKIKEIVNRILQPLKTNIESKNINTPSNISSSSKGWTVRELKRKPIPTEIPVPLEISDKSIKSSAKSVKVSQTVQPIKIQIESTIKPSKLNTINTSLQDKLMQVVEYKTVNTNNPQPKLIPKSQIKTKPSALAKTQGLNTLLRDKLDNIFSTK